MNSINNKLAFIAIKFYRIIRKFENGNIIIPPPCIVIITNALLNGSTDETRSQLLDVFGISVPDNHNVEKIILEILHRCQYESILYTSNELNSQYVSRINKEIISIISNYTEFVNKYEFDQHEYVQSAFTFNIQYTDIWETMFAEYGNRDFYVTNYIRRKIPFIITSGMLGYMYCPELKARVINIPYLHNTYSLILLYTDNFKNMKYLENNITSYFLVNRITFNNMNYIEFSVAIPKFSATSQHNLKPVFTSLGVTNLFSEKSSMKIMTKDKFSLSKVCIRNQVDFINNRIILSDQKKWQTIHSKTHLINKPFMFCIKYNKSGSIIFFGKIKDPVNKT